MPSSNHDDSLTVALAFSPLSLVHPASGHKRDSPMPQDPLNEPYLPVSNVLEDMETPEPKLTHGIVAEDADDDAALSAESGS
jgi:hypothetical protein